MSRNNQQRGKTHRRRKNPDTLTQTETASSFSNGIYLPRTNNALPSPAQASRMLNAAFAAEAKSDLGSAVDIYRKLTRQFPKFAPGWHYYGLTLHRQKKSELALDMLYEAHQIEPENPLFLSNVALVLWDMGDIDNSLRCLSRAHELDPDHAQIFMQYLRGMIATEQGDTLIPEIERHLSKAPGEWRLWTVLAKCREQGGDRDGAIDAYDKAVELAPINEIEHLLLRGHCLQKAGRSEEARLDYEACLKRSPNAGRPLSALASLASDRGDFEQAESLAREALEKEPQLHAAWDMLALSHPLTPEDDFRKQLEDALGEAPKGANVAPLHFALGKIYEKTGNYDQSFDYYQRGNELRKQLRPYSQEMDIAYSKGLIKHIDKSFLARSDRLKALNTGAIFICGMPRSGTTLVETILGSHPDVTPGGEQRYIHDYFRRTLKREGLPELGLWLKQAEDKILSAMAEDWAKELRRKASGAPRITDKLPGNYALLGLIHTFFPDAHIIHVQRDARDNCFSCYATPFAEGHAFSYDLTTLGYHHRLYQQLMANWRQLLDEGQIIEIKYESLVESPETETRRLLDALGLEWNPLCLEFHKSSRSVQTASKYQVRQPMYSTSINRWKKFEKYLKPLLDALENPSPLV